MIRFGIIGTSCITDKFIEAASLLKDFKLNAIYSRNEKKAREFGDKYSVENIYTDINEMAQSDKIDAIYIASPNSLHCEYTIKFLNNGKHVLCEKPIASNSIELKLMVEAAGKNNLLLMEAIKGTFLPNFTVIKENLHKIGKIRRYFASYCQYSSRYDKYKQGLNPNTFNLSFSNGSLMDIGIYCVYPAVQLFGSPNSINASGILLESGVDGEGSIVMNYDEMDCVIIHSKIADSHLPCEIQGENGSMVIDKIHTPENVKIIYKDGTIEDLTQKQNEKNMMYEVEEFINLIKNNQIESKINSYKCSTQVMNILDECRKQMGVIFPADL